MFKVLLRYIIRVCLFSAILLYLRTHFEEVRGSKERTSTRLLMKNVKSRKSEKEMRFQEDQRSKAEDDNCTTGNTKSGISGVMNLKYQDKISVSNVGFTLTAKEVKLFTAG